MSRCNQHLGIMCDVRSLEKDLPSLWAGKELRVMMVLRGRKYNKRVTHGKSEETKPKGEEFVG